VGSGNRLQPLVPASDQPEQLESRITIKSLIVPLKVKEYWTADLGSIGGQARGDAIAVN
jgi:hypothetical protein